MATNERQNMTISKAYKDAKYTVDTCCLDDNDRLAWYELAEQALHCAVSPDPKWQQAVNLICELKETVQK